VARRRSQKCQGVVVWMSVPFDRIRGLGASPEGIPTSTSSYSLEYVLGCLESVARALAMYGRTLSRPLLRRSRAAVEPRSRASLRSLETYGGFGVAVEPPSLARTRSIGVPAVFCRATLTLLLQEGGGGVGNAVLPPFGRVPTISGELLTGKFE
jgi:hypothetical protein